GARRHNKHGRRHGVQVIQTVPVRLVNWPAGFEPAFFRGLPLGGGLYDMVSVSGGTLEVAQQPVGVSIPSGRLERPATSPEVERASPCCRARVPGGSRTRLSGLEDRRLGRSATGTCSGRRGS